MKKIAFLFLIYDTINNEEAWVNFFDSIDENKYSIYIHYKTDKTSQYFEQYKIKDCVETHYGTISLVNAQNKLLEHALKDNANQHFIFVSGACIPLKPFKHIYNNLIETRSYFNIAPHEQCFPRCDKLSQTVNRDKIQKASQWCILNRKHASLMIGNTHYMNWYNGMHAPDEICYITNIFIHNLQNEIITTPNEANNATTFTNWYGMDYKYASTKSLKNYSYISQTELDYLLHDSRCFFGRKFSHDCRGIKNNETYLNFISENNDKPIIIKALPKENLKKSVKNKIAPLVENKINRTPVSEPVPEPVPEPEPEPKSESRKGPQKGPNPELVKKINEFKKLKAQNA